jgi:hypothetical protein
MQHLVDATSRVVPWIAALALVAGAGAQTPGGARRAGIFEEGRRAPALELPTIDGRSQISLPALAGKKVILLQFASW